jgi:hypothetical protein
VALHRRPFPVARLAGDVAVPAGAAYGLCLAGDGAREAAKRAFCQLRVAGLAGKGIRWT